MPFTPKSWENSPATGTPLSAAGLQDLETRLSAYTDSAAAQGLTPTAVKTGAYTAGASDFIPVDISAGSVPIALPATPPDKTRIGLKIVAVSGTPGSTTLTINRGGADVFNLAGGSTSLTLTAKFHGVLLQYNSAAGIWYVQATDTPLGVPLGAAQLGSDSTIGGPSGSALAPSLTSQSVNIFNVASYGAKGDAKIVNDAVVKNASTALESAEAAFTNADVGKVVTVAGAGAAGAGLNTTIVSVAAGVATMAAEAKVTSGAHRCVFGTDDSAAVAAAVTALGSAPGVLLVPGKSISGKVVLRTGQVLRGLGYEISALIAKAALNDNLVETFEFATLSGTDTTASPYNIQIENIRLDGNRQGQTGNEGGPAKSAHVIAKYAYGCTLKNVRVGYARQVGIWSEWSLSGPALNPDSMEDFWENVKVHNCSGVEALAWRGVTTSACGVLFAGPHDSQLINVDHYQNGNGAGKGQQSWDFPLPESANGSVIIGSHVYGGTHDYCIRLKSSGLLIDETCQFEGAGVAQIDCAQPLNRIQGKLFSGNVNTTAVGLLVRKKCGNLVVKLKVENLEGPMLELETPAELGNCWFDIYGQSTSTFPPPAEPIVGAYTNATNIVHAMYVNKEGTVTFSYFQFPGKTVLQSTLKVVGALTVEGALNLLAESVVSAAIAALAITEAKLGEESVAEKKIKNAAVTAGKMSAPAAKPAKPAEGATAGNTTTPAKKRTVALVGNGALKNFVIKHELGTRLLVVSVQKASGEEPGAIEPLVAAFAEFVPTAAGEGELKFVAAPGAGVQFFVTVVG